MRLTFLLYRAASLFVRIFAFVLVFGLGLGAAAMGQGTGYWHTSGVTIYDANNQPVRIAGTNWYGFETTDAVVHGLSAQDYKTILKTIKNNGYNTVRVPFSNQMVETPSTNLNITYYNSFGPVNTDLQGLNSLQVLDKIVTYAGTIGLKIILDNHRSEAGNSAEASGLWYTGSYPESNWIADWQALATRYLGNPTVVGFDLRNEPHNAYSGGSCWDCGTPTNDWHLAAERAGNAVQAINPNLLIFVEGTDAYNNNYYWWGGNLQGVANSPVVLSVANHLVYSAHDYGPEEYGQSWFNGDSAASLDATWTSYWAYINLQGIAPVWLGEFGTDNVSSNIQGTASGSQGLWFQSLTTFLYNNPSLNWTYWALNGEDSYALLDANYDSTPVSALKESVLATIQFPLNIGTTTTTPPAAPTALTASAASSSQVNLSWAASTTSGVTYTLYFGTSAGSIGTIVASNVAGTSYTATGLNASTTYYFTVTAVSASGTSAVSNTASATTPAEAVTAAPTGLAASAVSSSQINLAWVVSATPGVTYSVYSGTSATAITTLVTSGLAGTAYSATGLNASTTYYFAVVAAASGGSSAPSTAASATTLAAAPPAAPSGLTATAASSSQINLAWTASSTAGVTYSVYSGSSLVASGIPGTTYSVTGLSPSTSYTYTVEAFSGTTASAASNPASATTQSASATAPNAPFGLSASPSSASQVNLNWQPSTTSGVTYSVYLGTVTGVTSTLVAGGLTSTNYGVTGLLDSTTYYFTVKAVSSGGVASAASNQASATTQTLPATPPTGVTASAASSTQINLSWTAVPNTGATYSVYYGTQPGAENTLLASGIAGTSYQATNLTASTTYYFMVRSVSGGGTSAPSAQASATTLGASAPAAPAGLTAAATSTTQINLAWNAVAGGGTYSVYLGATSGGESTLLASGLTGTTYSAGGLTAGTTYYFVVKAVTSAGTSGASNEASAKTQTPPVPSAPTNLTATATSTSAIALSWTASATSGVTYSVFSGTATGAETALATGVSGTSYTATGLPASTTYYFEVKAVSSAGTSAASNEASATTQAAIVPVLPVAPTGLTATAASSSQINLAWAASTTAGVTYSVYTGASAGSIGTLVASGLAGTSYAATGLTASTTYFYAVTAVSSAGSSAASNAASATTPAPPAPVPPTGLKAAATSDAQIALSWTASPTAGVSYSVFSGTASGAETPLATGVNGTSYTASGLTASTAYFFTVKAANGATASAASNEASATTQAAPSGGCHVDYVDQTDWGSGFTGALSITNNSATAWTSWTVTWTYSGNQQIYQAWSSNYTQAGENVTLTNAAWNGSVTPGGTVSGIGWNANYSGANTNPVQFYVNGVACH